LEVTVSMTTFEHKCISQSCVAMVSIETDQPAPCTMDNNEMW